MLGAVITGWRVPCACRPASSPVPRAELATSGRAVLFAGSTVVISLLGLLLVGLPYITGAAIGASTAVLLVMAAAVTLLPATLGVLGPRIDSLKIPLPGRDRGVALGMWWLHLAAKALPP